jgi:cytochrome c oxidase subunit 5a
MAYLDFTRGMIDRHAIHGTSHTRHLLCGFYIRLQFDNWLMHVFCKQRNLNNCFAYDLVPSVEVLTAALKAARRVNDFPTAVRVFEGTLPPHPSWSSSIHRLRIHANILSRSGVKAKVENPEQYKQYLEALEGLRVELGVALREELYPQEA